MYNKPTKNDPKTSFTPDASMLFQIETSKSQQQQVKIIEAAIDSFAKNGIERTTYTSLAAKCKISRPLINHYFPHLEDLFLLAAKYIRLTLLNSAKAGMQKGGTDLEKILEGYIAGCFQWLKDYPNQARFWLLYYYQAGLGGQALKDNTELVSAGHERISGLLNSGKALGVWHFEEMDNLEMAKLIQYQITGGLISVMTETGYTNLDRAQHITTKFILSTLRKK